MIFNSVGLKNFKSYPDTEQTVSLNHTGIKLITGANGLGKSTIIEAILWCIYGKSFQETVDDVVNRYTKKNCKVSVNFDIQGTNYTVYRYRSHDTHGNALYIFKDEENISLKLPTDTQQRIQDIIQIPFIAMTNSIIFSSELYSSFLRSSRADRLKTLESVLSLKEISIYYESVKKTLSSIDEQIGLHNEKIGKANVGIETIKTTVEQYKEKAKTTLNSLKQERVDLVKAIETLNNDIVELDKIDIANEMSNIEKIEKNKLIQIKIDEERNKFVNTAALEKNIFAELDIIEKIKDIDVKQELNKINEYEKNKALKDEIDNNIKDIERNIVNVSPLELKLKTATESILKEKENIESIKDKSECPVCHQEVNGAAKEKLRKEYEEKINIFIEDKKNDTLALEERKKINEEYKSKIQALEEEKSKIVLFTSNYTREELSSISDRINQSKNNCSILKTRIEEGTKFNENIKANIDTLTRDLFDVTESKYSIETINSLVDTKLAKQKLIRDHTNRIFVIDETAKNVYDKSFVDTNTSRIKAIQTILTQEEKQNNDLKEEKRYYDILFNLFSNKESGFKKYFIGKMINFFNESINFYIPFFFDKTVSVVFDKDLNETITIDGMNVAFKSFSAGMKTRVEIAIAFGLFQLSKTFFSSDTNLLVFDEILDQNLDTAGFNAVIEVINGMADNSIFIISHQDAIKDSFEDIIKIEADDNGFSKIVA